MINIRNGVYETNSSSNHSLTLINNEIYEKWRNHEIVLKIEYEWGEKLDQGDRGLFGTWGNFFCDRGSYEVAGIVEQVSKNMEILSPYLNDPQVSDKLKRLIIKYKETGDTNLILNSVEDLFLTPEEYYESLKLGDCQSPFIYKGDGVVAIGHYYWS